MKSELEKDGHIVELTYTTRKETIRNVEHLVATNGTLDRDERSQFWSKWKTENYALLDNQLGFKTQAKQFVDGVFFMASFSQKTGPELQTLFMADACHLNFGTLCLRVMDLPLTPTCRR